MREARVQNWTALLQLGRAKAEELVVLDELAAWIAVNGEGIYSTRPWKISGEGSEPVSAKPDTGKALNERDRRALNATDVRFTTKGSDAKIFRTHDKSGLKIMAPSVPPRTRHASLLRIRRALA